MQSPNSWNSTAPYAASAVPKLRVAQLAQPMQERLKPWPHGAVCSALHPWVPPCQSCINKMQVLPGNFWVWMQGLPYLAQAEWAYILQVLWLENFQHPNEISSSPLHDPLQQSRRRFAWENISKSCQLLHIFAFHWNLLPNEGLLRKEITVTSQRLSADCSRDSRSSCQSLMGRFRTTSE